jgi:hypothetical protein
MKCKCSNAMVTSRRVFKRQKTWVGTWATVTSLCIALLFIAVNSSGDSSRPGRCWSVTSIANTEMTDMMTSDRRGQTGSPAFSPCSGLNDRYLYIFHNIFHAKMLQIAHTLHVAALLACLSLGADVTSVKTRCQNSTEIVNRTRLRSLNLFWLFLCLAGRAVCPMIGGKLVGLEHDVGTAQ